MFSCGNFVKFTGAPSTIRLLDPVGQIVFADEFGFYIVRANAEIKMWDYHWEQVSEIRIHERYLSLVRNNYKDFVPCGFCTACVQGRDCLRPEPSNSRKEA